MEHYKTDRIDFVVACIMSLFPRSPLQRKGRRRFKKRPDEVRDIILVAQAKLQDPQSSGQTGYLMY